MEMRRGVSSKWRKPSACLEQSSALGGVAGRCYATKARAMEGANVAMILVTSSVMKGVCGDSSREAVFSKVAHH